MTITDHFDLDDFRLATMDEDPYCPGCGAVVFDLETNSWVECPDEC